jgi:LCP family protein required for cell wall assembly
MQPHEGPFEARFNHPDAVTPLDSSKGLPPEPVSPAEPPVRYRMPKPPRRRGGALRKLLSLVLLVAVLAVVLYGIFLINIVAKVSTNSWQLGPLAADAAGRTNVVVLGVGDPGHAGEQLSDTIMLLSLDSKTKRMAQVSVPRDLRVTVPGHGPAKINAANVYGGVTVAEQTVSNTLGVPIHYYLKTNFSGLKNIVDAVGGIDVTVKDRLVDAEYPCDDNQYKVCGLRIEPGLQHMDGTRALQYVRCRKGTCGNDFGRAARQQEVLSLLRPKLTDWHLAFNPARLKLIAEAAQKGISTDMGLIQLLELANTWRADAANAPISLVLSTSTGGYLRSDPAGSSDLLPVGGNFSAISNAVQSIFSAQ